VRFGTSSGVGRLLLATCMVASLSACEFNTGQPSNGHSATSTATGTGTSPDSSRPSSDGPPSIPDDLVTSLFDGPSPVSVLSFWRDNPTYSPPVVQGSEVVLEQKGSGPSSFELTSLANSNGYRYLQMILTCRETSAYEVSLQSPGVEAPSAWSKGDSCGGPGINIYTSPPIDPAAIPDRIVVKVPTNTEYYIVVLGRNDN
jgi:hypothetical protein